MRMLSSFCCVAVFGLAVLTGCGETTVVNPPGPTTVKKETKIEDGGAKTKIETKTENPDGSTTKTKEVKETTTK